MNVTHILYTGDFSYVYIGETIADFNTKKPKRVYAYSLRFGPGIQQLPVFIAPLAPTGTLQASTGHHSFSSSPLPHWKGRGEGGIQLVVICNLTARCHYVLHSVPLTEIKNT